VEERLHNQACIPGPTAYFLSTMGLFLPGRRVRNKRFDYEPRFYNPKKDEKLKKRMRIQAFNRRRRSPMGIVYFIILCAMAVYVYQQLG